MSTETSPNTAALGVVADRSPRRASGDHHMVDANGDIDEPVFFEEIERLRNEKDAREQMQLEHEDATLGGLLTTDGLDVRRNFAKQTATQIGVDGTVEEVVEIDERRKESWRGLALAPNAAIQWDFAVETFDYKVQAMDLTAKLFVYLAFIIAFSFFFLVDRDVNNNFYLQKVFFDPITGSEIAKLKVAKFFLDITSAVGFVDFICDIVLIQTVDYTYPTGGNYFVGSFRVRTQRALDDSCTVNDAVIPSTMPAVFQQCYGPLTDSTEDTGLADNAYNANPLWKYKSCDEMGGGTSTYGWTSSFHCGGYYFEVPWWRDIEPENVERLSVLTPFPSSIKERMPIFSALYQFVTPPMIESNPPFLDNVATRFVTVEWFVYNAALQTFGSVKMFAEVANGGYWVPNYQFRVFSIWTRDNIPKTVYDGFFYLFVLYYIFQFFADLHRFHRRERKILAFFFDMWNILEMVNLAIFIVVLGFRIAFIKKCADTNLEIDLLVYNERYPVELDDIMNAYMMQVYLNSVNVVLTFMKLLKFLRLNDRLNVLTRTLSASQDSIFGVLVIFFLIVTAYAMTGYGLFGLGVWAFRSIDQSFSTLLQMLVGDIDYESLRNENRVEAGFFFWSYVILANFCLLNFLIGVLMEAFGEVSQSKPLLPLESVLAKTWSDWRRTLLPANLWHDLVQYIKGNSKEVLLMDAVEMLREYREKKYKPGEIPIDQEVLTLEDYEIAIDAELADKVGQGYMAYIWDDLVYEWDRSNEADEAIKSHRDIAMTTKGVKAAIGKHMKLIEGFSGRLTDLEKNLTTLQGLLDGKQRVRP
ncbi:cation channel protein, putative [Bodo saltans]|uniref:Cation channel protein, putative n=1 Tax=Bodo saltans TaxID=75058 RepID=A0A0S4JE62_BODSA|nr:cation channel protein, putative [Bodo saltans]|eukprot:CUG88331.1 cation channel protein, putative [Bodo saltans]